MYNIQLDVYHSWLFYSSVNTRCHDGHIDTSKDLSLILVQADHEPITDFTLLCFWKSDCIAHHKYLNVLMHLPTFEEGYSFSALAVSCVSASRTWTV